jgi:hypothetical protein
MAFPRSFPLPSIFAIAVSALFAAPATAEFVGTLKLSPAGCEKKGKCTLAKDFGFIDLEDTGWLAKAGDKTDGASIPGWAQPIVGLPFDKEFIKAAVIHDHYCDRMVRTWQTTHKAFYHALRESGVSKSRAKIMYGAVYLGGPRWKEVKPGTVCAIGKVCVFKTKPFKLPAGSTAVENEKGKVLLARGNIYGSKRFKKRFAELKKKILEQGLSPAQIAAEVEKYESGSLFLKRAPLQASDFEQ